MKAPQSLTRSIGKIKLFGHDNGPTILIGLGVAGFAATTVLVGKAVIKSQPLVQKLQEDIQEVVLEAKHSDWDDKHRAQEVAKVWFSGSFEIVKVFAPAIIVGTGSVACVLAAHGILQRQKGALVAAYAAIDASYRAYRERIRDEYGEEKERELYTTRYNRTREGFDDEGTPCVINENDPRIRSDYGRFFDDTSANWNPTAEYNRTFLLAQQRFANQKLEAQGWLFLNDVYDALGLPRSQAGQIVGWTVDGTDRYIDFNLDQLYSRESRAFTNGLESVVWLDFNVDGPINITKYTGR